MSLIIYLRIQWLLFKRWLLALRSNYLVRKHIRLTPVREDIKRDIILEDIRYKQRTIEQKRWTLWVKICELAKKLGVDEAKIRTDSVLAHFETEDTLIKQVELKDDSNN